MVALAKGDIVWAKITGYPWWPAQITILPSEGSHAYRIDFFNDSSQYFHGNAVPSFPGAS